MHIVSMGQPGPNVGRTMDASGSAESGVDTHPQSGESQAGHSCRKLELMTEGSRPATARARPGVLFCWYETSHRRS